MRRTIQRAIGDPLSEEMIRGRFKECRKIRVVLRDGAPAFIEQEAMAGVYSSGPVPARRHRIEYDTALVAPAATRAVLFGPSTMFMHVLSAQSG